MRLRGVEEDAGLTWRSSGLTAGGVRGDARRDNNVSPPGECSSAGANPATATAGVAVKISWTVPEIRMIVIMVLQGDVGITLNAIPDSDA